MAAVSTLTGLGLAPRLVRGVEGASIKARRGRVLTQSYTNSYCSYELVSVDPADPLAVECQQSAEAICRQRAQCVPTESWMLCNTGLRTAGEG
ncbi:unnamed protein product [Lota lota]